MRCTLVAPFPDVNCTEEIANLALVQFFQVPSIILCGSDKSQISLVRFVKTFQLANTMLVILLSETPQ